MTYKDAVSLIGEQDRRIRKIDNIRFTYGEYEYRLKYMGGFTAYVGIDRRKIGKRRYEYFGGIGAYNCMTVGEVMDLVMKKVNG